MRLSRILKDINDFSKKEHIRLYFAGGFLRDRLLGKNTKDIDLVVSGRVRNIAASFANRTGGSLICLDKEHDIYRISGEFNCDFSRLQGRSIQEDLAHRDFTIDAMAVEVDKIRDIASFLIDPFNGRGDLASGVIRYIKESVFRADPLRILRAYRLSAILGFRILPKTLKRVKKDAGLLKNVSAERIRDELFMIMGTAESHVFIKMMHDAGILRILMPEMDLMHQNRENYYHKAGLWGHSLESLVALEDTFGHMKTLFPRWHNKINNYLDEDIIPSRTRRKMLKFATFFHDIGKPLTVFRDDTNVHFFGHEPKGCEIMRKIMKRLKMSNKEISLADKLIRQHMRPGNLALQGKPSKKAVFRFFRDLEGEGIATLLLSLADRYSYLREGPHPQEIKKHEIMVKKVINMYFAAPKRIKPKPVINGHDIMRRFELLPGPFIGELLDMILEAQAEGRVRTSQDAFELIEERVKIDGHDKGI